MKYLAALFLSTLIFLVPTLSYGERTPTNILQPPSRGYSVLTLSGVSLLSIGIGGLTTALMCTQWEPITAEVEVAGLEFVGSVPPNNSPGLWAIYGIAVAAIVTGVILLIVEYLL